MGPVGQEGGPERTLGLPCSMGEEGGLLLAICVYPKVLRV